MQGAMSEDGVRYLGYLCRALREQLCDDIRDFVTVVQHGLGRIGIEGVDYYQNIRCSIKSDAERIRANGKKEFNPKVRFTMAGKAQKKAHEPQPASEDSEADE